MQNKNFLDKIKLHYVLKIARGLLGKGGIRINWVLWKLELEIFVHDPKLHQGLVYYSNYILTYKYNNIKNNNYNKV